MSKKENVFRSRKFSVLVYPEWGNFKEIIETVEKQDQYVYIKHVGETEEKKEHYHIYLKFKNARYNTALANLLGIETRFVKKIDIERDFIRYLIHKDNKEKRQYSFSDLKFSENIGDIVHKAYIDIKSDYDIEILIDFVRLTEDYVTKHDIIDMAIRYNMLGDLKNYWWVLKELIEEHNRYICNVSRETY